MKLQILKVSLIIVSSVFSLFGVANIALSDSLNSAGSGGNYRYELWSTDDNYYSLKIWSNEASPNSSPNATITKFISAKEALIYFDCNYAGKTLPECPRS